MQHAPKPNPNVDAVAAYLAGGGSITKVGMTQGKKGITRGQCTFRSGNHVKPRRNLVKALEHAVSRMPDITTVPEVRAPRVVLPTRESLMAMTNTAIVALFNTTFEPFGTTIPGHTAKRSKAHIVALLEERAASINVG